MLCELNLNKAVQKFKQEKKEKVVRVAPPFQLHDPVSHVLSRDPIPHTQRPTQGPDSSWLYSLGPHLYFPVSPQVIPSCLPVCPRWAGAGVHEALALHPTHHSPPPKAKNGQDDTETRRNVDALHLSDFLSVWSADLSSIDSFTLQTN